MRIIIEEGDVLEIEFNNAEEVFEVKNDHGLITVKQISGFLIDPEDSDFVDEKTIYMSE